MLKRQIYLDRLEMYLNRDVVKIITGVRRCGKTTLIKQFIESLKECGVRESNILYMDFESLACTYLHEQEQLRDLLAGFLRPLKEHAYIFLDEVQCISGWARVASEMTNLHDCEIFVTASNMSVFDGDFAGALSYRYVRINMWPLSFGEYLELMACGREAAPGAVVRPVGNAAETADGMGTVDASGKADAAEEAAVPGDDNSDASHTIRNAGGHSGSGDDNRKEPSEEDYFADYLVRGGMPGVYQVADGASAQDYLIGLYSSIILRDVVQCRGLREVSHIDRIMEYLMTHIGEAFSPKAVRDYVAGRGTVISVDTVYSCLDALCRAFLIYRVPRYDVRAGRELETLEKYYICDMSIRDAVMGGESTSLRARLESVMGRELMSRGFDIYAAKSGRTLIDFMAVRGQNRTYINICETVTDKDLARAAFGPLTRLKDNYFKMVISMDPETMVNRGGIINFPAARFLTEE